MLMMDYDLKMDQLFMEKFSYCNYEIYVIYKKYFIIYDRVLYLIQIKSKHCCWQKMKKLRISTENRERETREGKRKKKNDYQNYGM